MHRKEQLYFVMPKLKKITPSQILAVGDSGNDLSMLSLDLGVTAAMANASATVKDVCSVIAPSNDQDGVAFLIEDNFRAK